MKNVILLLLIGLTAGCVSSSKYKNLEKDLSTTKETAQAKAQEYQEKVQQQEAAIAEQKVLIAGLERKLGAASSDKESLKASVEQMKQALAEMTERQKETRKRIAEYRDLIKRFGALTKTGQLSVRIEKGRMIVGLPSDVLFTSGSARLSPEGAETIKKVSLVLLEIPDNQYQIEGHTDNVPISTQQFPSNWELAAARGLNVLNMMIEAGMPPERVSAASFGEHRPIASNDSAEGHKQNRRIEIVIVPDLSTLPGHEELEKLGR